MKVMKMFAAVFCAAVLFTAVGCGDKEETPKEEETPKYDEKMLVGYEKVKQNTSRVRTVYLSKI